MKFGRLTTTTFAGHVAVAATFLLLGAIAIANPQCAMAQEAHMHSAMSQPEAQSAEQRSQAATLLATVREATARFQDVRAAEAEGYSLLFGCVTGPDAGAMGLHYVNLSLVAKNELDPRTPQIIIYEPTPDGRVKLTGADFLVLAADWDKAHPGQPPELMGQLFHYFEAPNRFGLPAFYTLHVWAWKENPNGAFVNWHPKVSCASFGSN
jgi:hypothetical protein